MKKTRVESRRARKSGLQGPKFPWIAIVGNPNSGKTAIFNHLTGSSQKVGNYPGVTVEKKTGRLKGQPVFVHDLPGAYSLSARSLDEEVVVDMVQEWRIAGKRPMAVVVVVDATNLSRHLFLTLQILEWGLPTVVVLNMMDEVRKKGIAIDVDLLRHELQAEAVVETSAKTGEGLPELLRILSELPREGKTKPMVSRFMLDEAHHERLAPLIRAMERHRRALYLDPVVDSVRLLADDAYDRYLRSSLNAGELEAIRNIAAGLRDELDRDGISYASWESAARYRFIDRRLAPAFSEDSLGKKTFSEHLDAIVSHTVWGPLILLLILGFIFNTIFSWAEYPMNRIEEGVNWVAGMARLYLPSGLLKELLIDGVIVGVGNVLVFLPQIVLLVFFISLLEDSGYIARMAFILDRLMNKMGLHGKAVLPMLSGFACAIPAIMTSRTIENWRDRLITIMLIPLMSCSARLPVYTLLISAFVPRETIWGFIQVQGLVLMGMYFLGFFTAVFISMLIKRFYPETKASSFILELPPYRTPIFRSLWRKVYDSGKLFVVNAGSIILAISVILWFLASYPQPADDAGLSAREKVEQSYAGQLGHFLEPAVAPLGFDWKIGVGIIASFAAREVLVSTFATLYNIEQEDDEDIVPLVEAMRRDRRPDGRPVFTLLVAVSLMVFFVYAAQCMATFAIVKRETNSWRWPVIMVVYMTALAYIASLIVYQGGVLLGWG